MYLETILAIIVIRYLRKNLDTANRFPSWDRVLIGVMVVSIGLAVLETSYGSARELASWLSHALLLGLVGFVFSRPDFSSARPIMYAVLPYIVIAVLNDFVELVAPEFYQDYDDYFQTASSFAVLWMLAMWLINQKQRKALEKEKEKAKEKEKEYRITQSLKDALEVQVAERTAALTQQKEALQQTLNELKATQAQLIQSEKMASLGELTAGIAHEIQNPLNFVNNFSEVNTELIAEMKTEIEKGNLEEVKALAEDIAANEEKISQHGKRADAIVKGMLHHSRTSSGVKEPTDINGLADEYFRLAYHGLRAKDKSFNATLKTAFDETIGNISIVPQDIGRVMLNLITNAFYAVAEKKRQQPVGYDPTVTISTRKQRDGIEISILDNGNGIPEKVLDKVFQPFFTTKPAGQGTGLGLSLSYEIIRAHGGELNVKTAEGEYAEFIIYLPLNQPS